MTYIAYLEEHPLRARLLTTAAQDMCKRCDYATWISA